MKIKCIAIDDEPMALEKIKNYINDIPYLELLAVCRGVHEAKAVLEEADVDAMFIDISMPDMSGMDFVKSLDNPPYVIFTTAYSEYAVKAMRFKPLIIFSNHMTRKVSSAWLTTFTRHTQTMPAIRLSRNSPISRPERPSGGPISMR